MESDSDGVYDDIVPSQQLKEGDPEHGRCSESTYADVAVTGIFDGPLYDAVYIS